MTRFSHDLIKRFSLKAAAVLATAGAVAFAEPVFASENTSPVSNTAETTTTTVDAEELTVQITGVTLLEERAATFQAYAENFGSELPVAREELDKTKTNLETTYSNPAATETEKLSASMEHSFATAYYEGVAEAGSHFKDLAETTTQAKDNLLQQAPNLEHEIEALPTEQKLEVYRAIRQTIEHEMALIDSERQAAQELVDQAEEAIRTADLDMPLDDYSELIKHLARVTAWSNLPELTYDYSVIDADIKALEDLLAQEAGQDNSNQDDTDNGSDTTGGDQGGTDTGNQGDADKGSDTTDTDNPDGAAKVALTVEQITQIFTQTFKADLNPSILFTLPLSEVLDKLAGAQTDQAIQDIIQAYIDLERIPLTKSVFDKEFKRIDERYKAAQAEYESVKPLLTEADQLFRQELIYSFEKGYHFGASFAYGNYPYLILMDIETATKVVQNATVGQFETLSPEKKLELLQKLSASLQTVVTKSTVPNSNRPRIWSEFKLLLENSETSEKDLIGKAGRYGEGHFWFNPVYTYDFTDLNNRIAALTKTEDNNQTAGSTVPGQSSSDQNPSGQTNQPDQTDKTDVVGQPVQSGNTTQTNPVEKDAQTRKTETAEEGNQDNKTNQTDDVKKSVASAPVAQPGGASQAKVLPATGEGRSAFLSALGLLSLVASVGVIAKKRQD